MKVFFFMKISHINCREENENNKLDVLFFDKKNICREISYFRRISYRDNLYIIVGKTSNYIYLSSFGMLKCCTKKWARVPILTTVSIMTLRVRKEKNSLTWTFSIFYNYNILGERDDTLLRIVATRPIVEVFTLVVHC